ncbi:MAG: glycosyltransferase family 4 protein [Actinobacteria bacterium]|nr:glycosyltransferase family 4 protein [Actinomycetota bacterium]
MTAQPDGSHRPKVLHLTTSDSSLDLLLRPQLEAFQAAGYEVITASAPGRYVHAVEASGIRHIPLQHATRSMDLKRDAAMVRELYRTLRRERPDIVHTHNPKPGWFGRVVSQAARVPVVLNTVHGLYATESDPRYKRYLVYTLERIAAAFSALELVQSAEDVDVLRKLRVPEERLVNLGNGIDLERFDVPTPEERKAARAALGIADDEIAVGVVGRLVWEKGLREVFEASRRLPTRVPGIRFLVAGPLDPEKADGLLGPDLDDIMAQSGVEFLGERIDIEAVYDALDIYLLASHREGFPRSAMEAAATGVPVVASNIRGCRQVVDDGVTGYLFGVGRVGELCDAVAKLAEDPERRHKMSEAARRKAEADFDQEHVIKIVLDAYERLLAERGIAPAEPPAG